MNIAQRLSFSKLFEAGKPTGGHKSALRTIRILLTVIVILDIALVVMLFRPPSPSVAERQKRYEESHIRNNQTLSTVKQMQDLKTKLQSAIQKDREFADSHFLRRRKAFSIMIANLELLASKNKLRTSTISYGLKEEKDQPGYVQVSVKMSIDGSYTDLIQFINSLEKSDLFWLIDNMQVSGSTGSGLRMALSMQTIAVLPEQKSEL
jgi:Tfp pilus assembly protein PilO